MERAVKHYSGYEITEEVLEKVNHIAMSRYDIGTFIALYDDINTLGDLCVLYECAPEQEHIVMGKDWIINYCLKDNLIELADWIGVETSSNKFAQTMEMFSEMKEILLLANSLGGTISAEMRHDTSYPFYKLFLDKGYLKSHFDFIEISPFASLDAQDYAQEVIRLYGTFENYFQKRGENEKPYDNYFYHSANFSPTDKFVKRYEKKRQ